MSIVATGPVPSIADAGAAGRLLLGHLALHGVQDGAAGVDVERVAELVGLGRGGHLDAGAQVPRVVHAGAAASHRAEQVAQGAIAQEVERLVGDLERDTRASSPSPPAPALPIHALAVQVGRVGDEAALHHAVDDLLDQVLELLRAPVLVAVGRLAEQTVQRLVGQHAAAEERVEDGVVQRLHRPVLVGAERVPHGLLNPLESSRSDSFDTRSSRSISSSRSPVYFV